MGLGVESKFKEMAFMKHTWESKINKHKTIKLSKKVWGVSMENNKTGCLPLPGIKQ